MRIVIILPFFFFAKMQFLKTFVIITLCFSVDLLLLIFLQPNIVSRRSTDSRQIWHKRVFLPVLEKDDFWKIQKPDHDGQKHRKIGHFFTPAVTFSLRVTNKKSYHLGCHSFQKMSLWQSRTDRFFQSLGPTERQKDRLWRQLSRKWYEKLSKFLWWVISH